MKDKPAETHPSFALVAISRVSGKSRLFDSPFEHQHYITLSIKRADRTRTDLHTDHIMGRDELIEVAMSEVQFAHMVTSLNMGQGTPCTITRHEGKLIKGPDPDQTKQHFAHEARQHFTDLAKHTEELEKLVNLPQKDIKVEQRERMKSLAMKIHQELTCNMDFFHEMFQETMEKVVNVAKGEIQAHLLNVVQKAGLESLQNMNLKFDEKK